jgi:hypothetical protein
MGGIGLEPKDVSLGLQSHLGQIEEMSAANCGARGIQDDRLTQINEVWARLPEEARSKICLIVKESISE